jgi:succinyl-diaminopimelate desuccinylase
MDAKLEIIQFLKRLVETPSQNGIDSEKKIACLVSKKLSSFGFSPKIVGNKKHPSVFCKINKNPKGKTVWLEVCLDTVAAGERTKWQYPPLKATIKGRKMYGRGTADSKTGIAIFCYLAKDLCQTLEFKGNLILGFDANEQSGEFTGIRNILKQRPKANVCVLGYPGIEEITIGGRGWLRLKITTRGKAAHTGARFNVGNNAIHQMIDIINALKNLDLDGKKELFFEYGPSLNISLVKGGSAINVVPDGCEARIDIRFLPSQSKKSIMEKIQKELKRLKKKNTNINYKIEVLQSENAFLTNPQNKFIKLLQKNTEKELKKKIPLASSGAGSVGNVISKLGIPIVNGFGCDFGNAHAPNEWIDITTIPKVFKIYRDTIIEYCSA